MYKLIGKAIRIHVSFAFLSKWQFVDPLPLYSDSMNEVLEFAEDFAIDIPKIWDYLGEIISPVVTSSALSLSFLASIYPTLVSVK